MSTTNTELIARLKEQCDRDAAEHCPAEIIALQAEGIAAIEALEAEVGRWKALSVTNIMLGIVPGDGSGLEVYAKSVDDVVNKLTELGSKAEDVQGDNVTLLAQLAVAQGQEPIHWVVPHYGFTFPTEEAAQQYQDNLECADRPIACYAAPIPQKPAWAPMTLDEAKALTAMVYGAPWSNNYCEGLLDVLAMYDELRFTGQRPVDPASPQPKETK